MLLFLLACQQDSIRIFTTEEQIDTIKFFVETIEDDRLEVIQSDNPSKSAQRYKGWSIALQETNEGTADAYRLSKIREGKSEWRIEGDVLGLQYGLADVLERMNYRFYHPYQSYVPDEPIEPQILDINEEWQEPEMVRRGLHMHTLHPIEGYYDFWEPVMIISTEPSASLIGQSKIVVIILNGLDSITLRTIRLLIKHGSLILKQF